MSFLGVPKLKRRLSINTLTETLEDQESQSTTLSKKLTKVEDQLKEIKEKIHSQGKLHDDLEVLIKEAQEIIDTTRTKIDENYKMVIKARECEAKLEENGGNDVVSLENKKLNDIIENTKEEFRKFRIDFHDNLKQIKTNLAKYEYYYEQRNGNGEEKSQVLLVINDNEQNNEINIS